MTDGSGSGSGRGTGKEEEASKKAATAAAALQVLQRNVCSITELYNDYAVPFELWEVSE